MPYLHLPFQSGADRILAAMNRKHTVADYLALVDAHPRGAPRPGALHRHHRRLSRRDRGRVRGHARRGRAGRLRPGLLVQVQPPARNARRRACAARCRKTVKIERLHRLQELLRRQQTSFNSACVGKVMPVLFERAGPPAGPAGRPLALPASRSCASRFFRCSGASLRLKSSGAGPNSLAGVLTAAEPCRRDADASAFVLGCGMQDSCGHSHSQGGRLLDWRSRASGDGPGQAAQS